MAILINPLSDYLAWGFHVCYLIVGGSGIQWVTLFTLWNPMVSGTTNQFSHAWWYLPIAVVTNPNIHFSKISFEFSGNRSSTGIHSSSSIASILPIQSLMVWLCWSTGLNPNPPLLVSCICFKASRAFCLKVFIKYKGYYLRMVVLLRMIQLLQWMRIQLPWLCRMLASYLFLVK